MSDTQAAPGQPAIDHLVRLLQMNPIHQGAEIIDVRREAPGLATEAKATRSPPAEEVRALRRKVLDQLEALRSQFWTMPIDDLNKQLNALDDQGFVDLEASIARLRIVAAHRDQFPLLSGKPGFDSDFLSVLKKVLIRSPRDTAVIREQVFSSFHHRSRRKRIRRMVALLKTEMPASYELEADWFDTLYRQKCQPPVMLVSSNNTRARTEAGGSKSDTGSYHWVIWIAIVALGGLSRSFVNDNNNIYAPRTPSIPSVPNYEFKPALPIVPREEVTPRVEDSKKTPSFGSDQPVWEPYSSPLQTREQLKSPNSFGNQDPLAPLEVPGLEGPGKHPMTDIPDEPDWSLLPHAPVRFFGLGPGFDRRDLKRSYNQLLRQFKPEQFPQEFQRIRAAYEQLENAIRYGGQTASASQPAEWHPSHAPSLATERSPALPLHERIQGSNVLEIYQELARRPDKSPYDFYSLAVMSDVVDPRQGQQFIHWILEGLTAHPNEIGLSRLLHAYFSGLAEAAHCEQTLVACSKIVREDLFFPLTEPLWRLMLRTRDFKDFSAALAECEANLKGVNIDNRLAFYLQILKPAMFVADPEWIHKSYNLIQQNFDRIPAYLDYDLEILSRLRTYADVRESLLYENELLRRLDGAMRDYFSEDQLTGDQSVLACQVLIAQDAEGLADALDDFGNSAYALFYAVWVWISYDVAERHVEPSKETLKENVWHPRTKALLSQLESQTVRSRLGMMWATRRVMYRCAQGLCFTALPLAICMLGVAIGAAWMDMRGNRRGDDAVIAIVALPAVMLGVFLGFRLSKRITARHWQPFTLRISADCYRQLWQREIVNFLARSHLPHRTFRAFLQSFPGTTTKSTAWVQHYVDLDFVLPMFAIAHCFVV